MGSVATTSVEETVAGSVGTSVSTGAGWGFVGGAMQAERDITIKVKAKTSRFIYSPYFVMF
jgi:hypothetical protein